MAQFNLDQYETVEERHNRALAEWPDMRVVMVNHSTPQDRASGVWVVECRVYKDTGDQANDLPKATEWAFEVDGQGMANKTSALENACTSALGRALRWAFAGSKGASRSEMKKVARGKTPQPPAVSVPESFAGKVAAVDGLTDLAELWKQAVAGGFSAEVQDMVTKRKGELS